MSPVVPPGTAPSLESATMMTENDVLCGRGGGTNSQMGNRRYRALVRDFQPTYLMAKRREKPLMARSVVLIVRHRGGRFLRRDDTDGRLFEVGDEKAEAKTCQALREGLDVRATKTAANTLMGTTGEGKRRKSAATAARTATLAEEQRGREEGGDGPGLRGASGGRGGEGAGAKEAVPSKGPRPVHAPGGLVPSRHSLAPPPRAPVRSAPRPGGPPVAAVPPPGGSYYPHHPPYPGYEHDPYYRRGYPPPHPPTSSAPPYDCGPGGYAPPPPPPAHHPAHPAAAAMYHHHYHHFAGAGGAARQPHPYPPHSAPYGGRYESMYPPSPTRAPREGGGGGGVGAFSPPRGVGPLVTPGAARSKVL
ncbi:hypothetical protein ACHAWF_013778 [Thalassiosira exigua]